MLNFLTTPPIGTVVRLDDQEFELIRVDDYQRLDGKMSKVLVWSTGCATCGEPFESKSPMKTSGLVRRCVAHSMAGKPVKGRRGRKINVEVIEA